jgi:hypothetical protein
MDVANEMDQETERLWFSEIIRTGLSHLQYCDAAFDGVNNIVDRGKSDGLTIIFGS